MTSHKTAVACLILAAIPASIRAEVCNPEEQTIAECQNAVSAQLAEENDTVAEYKRIAPEEIESSRRELRVATTGDVALNTLGTPVSLNDLLPVFNIAVEPATSGEQDESSSIVVEYSPSGPVFGGDVKAGLLARSPSIADPVRNAIGDSTAANALQAGLDYTDDVVVEFTYAYMGSIGGLGIGRDDRFYGELADGMTAAAAASVGIDANRVFGFLNLDLMMLYRGISRQGSAWTERIGSTLENRPYGELEEVLAQANGAIFRDQADTATLLSNLASVTSGARSPLGQSLSDCEGHLGNLEVADAAQIDAIAAGFAECVADAYVAGVREAVVQPLQRTIDYNTFLVNNGFFKLGGLINNQPQLLFLASARSRDDAAGGDELSAKLSFEFDLSGHNVNNLNRFLVDRKCADQSAIESRAIAAYVGCADLVKSYIADNPVEAGGWRGSVSVEYKRREDATLNLPVSMLPFELEGGRSLIASLVMGRQFQLMEGSNLPKAKLDIGLSYDDVSGDPMRNSRAVGNLTFTQELATAAQLSIGLAWANEPQYLGEVDQEVSARIGLNYKFAPGGK